MWGENKFLSFRSNMDENVSAGEAHPMRFATHGPDGETRPYIMIRDGLDALIVRSVFYDLVDLGVTHEVGGAERFGVWSAGQFFAMANAAELICRHGRSHRIAVFGARPFAPSGAATAATVGSGGEYVFAGNGR